MSDVYFTSFRSNSGNILTNRLIKILNNFGLENKIKSNSLTAIKTHFGELGNTRFISHIYLRFFIDYFKKFSERVFITDTNTIYAGTRVDAVTHLHTAARHGFNYSSLNVPVIIADGLIGKDEREIKINKKHFKNIKIASVLADSHFHVIVSHFKGHMLGGFGGALKNVGMGYASRSQKLRMHSSISPRVKAKKCTACSVCISRCPVNAIKYMNEKAYIDNELCIGCGECIAVCPSKAVMINWDEGSGGVQEKYVEMVYGVKKLIKDNWIFINFISDVTPDCDCMDHSDTPIVNDLGIAVSCDPVAIDHACVNIVNQAEGIHGSKLQGCFKSGEDKFKAIFPEIDWTTQLKYAESLGIGTMSYNLIRINE